MLVTNPLEKHPLEPRQIGIFCQTLLPCLKQTNGSYGPLQLKIHMTPALDVLRNIETIKRESEPTFIFDPSLVWIQMLSDLNVASKAIFVCYGCLQKFCEYFSPLLFLMILYDAPL